MEIFSVVINEELQSALCNSLIRIDKQEDLCFATYLPSTGKNRFTAIIQSIIEPEIGDREIHGNAGFASQYFERALSIALKNNEGLAFLHSHPWPGWQRMSKTDIIAETRIAPAVTGSTNLPLLGMTLGTDQSWSGRFWIKDSLYKRKYHCKWCENVRVLGEAIKVTFNNDRLKSNINPAKQVRTISAWGEKTQEGLSRLKIGIVGLGSVGSLVAEILARTGIANFTLIDFDLVEEKNLDRLTNVFEKDIGKQKVFAVENGILRSASSKNIIIQKVNYSVCEKEGFLHALDCDVLFSCVDRPWPRQVLNFIAYAHLIPVIDGGILIRTNSSNSKIKGADWKVQTVGYKRACLECSGQYKNEQANLERQGLMDDPSYIKGLESKIQKDAHENVYAFSSHLASMEVMQFLSLFVSPSGVSNVGQQMYHFVPGILDKYTKLNCGENCFFQSIIGKGDNSGVQVWDRHELAEKTRIK